MLELMPRLDAVVCQAGQSTVNEALAHGVPMVVAPIRLGELVVAEQVTRAAPTPDQIAYAEMPAGSAVVYTGGTIHAGGANTTETPRRGAHLSYCLGWLRTEENNYLSTPPAVAARCERACATPAACPSSSSP